ncbi:MAG: preprotein translocase subunit YajC [Fusobacterium gastrosuis]|uniref:preprotein translocase subunit YajC n=1 Tax=Fusobacterium TaxID=848 RepID=UPI001F4F87BB|nr:MULTISPECIES: preprotein translocase subunit YajC [Fusobacterium]MDD7392012.1 preprotein translocase subunit YajC [Fusobacteriaceae bacterium]MCI5724696.1 preprotein translocase subunit YajC [Fusobacterium sp.]MCI7223880.1 preprotein translocase subunit YajC [Fusobacterium sp.]MDD7410204.1 preprotein translocase subunit YajC [Fusobacteriaceae bacterium]MDY4010735.1 preprotein translocase subunit YajC [Fusobacterium gastrosuis]
MQELYAKYGSTFIIILVWIVIFYFLVMRPNKKKQKQQQELYNSLKEGVEVLTIGGIKGTIAFVGEEYVEIRVDKGVKLTLRKSAISTILNS